MNNIISSTNTEALTMSSKEIAELVEKRHDNVKRTIETLAKQSVISAPQIEDGNKSANGVIEKLYQIGKRDSYIVVAQLSPEFTARLVDRWQQLEDQARNPIANLSRKDLLKLALETEEENEQLRLEVKELAPKAKGFDRIADANGTMNPTVAAKALQVQPKRLFDWMREHHWIYRRPGGSGNVAYQDKIQAGLLTHKVTTVQREDGTEKVVEQVLVTGKGLAKLSQVFCCMH